MITFNDIPKELQPIEPQPLHFSYVSSLATGGYTYSREAPLSEKIRVIAMWFFSIITLGVFPAIAFAISAILDHQSKSVLDKEIDQFFKSTTGTDTEEDRELMWLNTIAKNDRALIREFMSELSGVYENRENISHLTTPELMQQIRDDEDYAFRDLSPFQILTAILIEEPMLEKLALANSGRIEISNGCWASPLDILTLKISEKRENMGEESWQAELADFEILCNVDKGTFAQYTNTHELIHEIIMMSDNIHSHLQEHYL